MIILISAYIVMCLASFWLFCSVWIRDFGEVKVKDAAIFLLISAFGPASFIAALTVFSGAIVARWGEKNGIANKVLWRKKSEK